MHTIHAEGVRFCSYLNLFSYTAFIKKGICLSYDIYTTRFDCICFLLTVKNHFEMNYVLIRVVEATHI